MTNLSFPLDELMAAIKNADDLALNDLLNDISEKVNARFQAITEGKAPPMTQEERDEFHAGLMVAYDAALQHRSEILGQLQSIERKKRAVHAYANY